MKENRKRLHSRVSDLGKISYTPYQTTGRGETDSPIISNTPSSAGANDPLIKKEGQFAQVIVTSSSLLPLNRSNSIK